MDYPMRRCKDGKLRPIPPQRTKEQAVAIFWSNVQKSETGCWPYKGRTVETHGHSKAEFKYGGAVWLVHQLAFFLVNGPIADGLEYCHSCDNPQCCNPKHIFGGTHAENMADMIRKGRSRHPAGEDASGVKLTERQVMEIRASMARRKYGTVPKLMKKYLISESNCWAIHRRSIWKHL